MVMSLRFACLALALLLIGCASGPTADLVLENGTIVTLDDDQSEAEALAAADGEILAVGSAADVESYVGDGTRVVDLEGRGLR